MRTLSGDAQIAACFGARVNSPAGNYAHGFLRLTGKTSSDPAHPDHPDQRKKISGRQVRRGISPPDCGRGFCEQDLIRS
jgi:hypothetical protein